MNTILRIGRKGAASAWSTNPRADCWVVPTGMELGSHAQPASRPQHGSDLHIAWPLIPGGSVVLQAVQQQVGQVEVAQEVGACPGVSLKKRARGN